MQPSRIPCLLFEDEHLLVVNKPAGIATHRAAEDAPWGMVEFLSNHRPDLPPLGIHQRLDRETSGVLAFAKSAQANRSLAQQFERRAIHKTYHFVTQGKSRAREFTAAEAVDGKPSTTHFSLTREIHREIFLWEARPETGRTHQVRIHAATHGLPIQGDLPSSLGLEPLLLHASRLEFLHPSTGKKAIFEAPLPDYFGESEVETRRIAAAAALRKALLNEKETTAYRLIHRESDGFPEWSIDRFGDWLYLEDFGKSSHCSPECAAGILKKLNTACPATFQGLLFSRVRPSIRREEKQVLCGKTPPSDLTIRENHILYHLEPLAPGGTGLFLDQRENRRRIRNLAPGGRVLNLFAYTCGFSVAAAVGGAVRTISVDLSKRVLEIGRKNFQLNGIDPSSHQFWAEDAWAALRRLAARRERFEIAVLDPPSSSRSKSSGHFSAKRDFAELVQTTAPLVASGGWLLCSTNLAEWKGADFRQAVEEGLRRSGRKIGETLWMPQPFDFPMTPRRPAHLKSLWLRLA